MNITEKAKGIIDSCRFCWMCRHVCPIGNATGQERNTARARALGASLVVRGAQSYDDIKDNLYECALCGACTNNCMTGWDPKVFVREMRTDLALDVNLPEYIVKLVENYVNCGNIYGKEPCECIKPLLDGKKADTLVFMGEDAVIKSPESVKKVKELLDKAKVDYTFGNLYDSGSSLYFLTGKTAETLAAAKRVAEYMSEYKTVVIYDPVDLSLIKHEFNEWGIDVKSEVIGFNDYLLSLIDAEKLMVNKSENEYSLQDHYAYARELDDTSSGRTLIEKVGKNKEMLLIGKEANLAGNLIMNEYMPEVMATVASDRWLNAKGMDCKTLVTENPAEYELLKANVPEGYRVISIEEMILENAK